MLQQLAQLTLNGIITGTILALTGVGATLVFGIQRVANFAHGEFLAFAAYITLLLNVTLGRTSSSPPSARWWPRRCWPWRCTWPCCGRCVTAAWWRPR